MQCVYSLFSRVVFVCIPLFFNIFLWVFSFRSANTFCFSALVFSFILFCLGRVCIVCVYCLNICAFDMNVRGRRKRWKRVWHKDAVLAAESAFGKGFINSQTRRRQKRAANKWTHFDYFVLRQYTHILVLSCWKVFALLIKEYVVPFVNSEIKLKWQKYLNIYVNLPFLWLPIR